MARGGTRQGSGEEARSTSQNPAILSYHAPFFSPLPNSHFSPSDIPLLTQSTFSSVSQPVGSQHTHPVSYTHLRAHETPEHLVCRLLLEKKKMKTNEKAELQREH